MIIAVFHVILFMKLYVILYNIIDDRIFYINKLLFYVKYFNISTYFITYLKALKAVLCALIMRLNGAFLAGRAAALKMS